MANVSVVPANQNPNNLLGPAASGPAALGVAPAGSQNLSAGNVLQPAASTMPAAQKVQSQPQITPTAQPQQAAPAPAVQAQTFSFGDGTSYDVNGNQFKPGGTPAPGGNQNQSIAAGAGSAGLYFKIGRA